MWKSENSSGKNVEQALIQLLPPCQIKCPLKEDIQRTNVLLSLLPDDIEQAKEGIIQIGDYLYDNNPMFNICGYVCGICELECNYKNKGGAIGRRLLKRFLSDNYTAYLSEKPAFPKPSGAKVAVIGGGPSGLNAAFQLGRLGYRVTIFEASARLGGSLWLIPDYRLPKDILSITCENMVRIANVEVKYNSTFGQDKITIDNLKEQGYQAFFVAKGSTQPRVLTFGRDVVPGQDLLGVMYGHTFLYEVSYGNIALDYFKNKRVIVIGGGNVALDAARTARRLGGDVTLVALERREEIPASDEEIRGAWEEGIKIMYSRGVGRIIGEGGKFKSIQAPKCVSVFDSCGFNPKFDAADSIFLTGDILLITVGQMADRSSLMRDGLIDENGRLTVDHITYQSAKRPEVFVGGDVQRIGFMVDGMHSGQIAAESIDRYLRGMDLKEGRKREYRPFELPLRDQYKSPVETVWIPPEKRLHFQLFERGYTLKEAIEEAKRCCYCGPCSSCRACVSVDFQDTIPVAKVALQKCSGCGMCVYACNYQSATLKDYDGDILSDTDVHHCKGCGLCIRVCPSHARHMEHDDLEVKIKAASEALS